MLIEYYKEETKNIFILKTYYCMDRILITKLLFPNFFLSHHRHVTEKPNVGTSPEKDINGLHRRRQKQKRFGKIIFLYCRCVEKTKQAIDRFRRSFGFNH